MKVLRALISDVEIVASKVSPELKISGIAQNTEQVAQGTLFFAISGTKFDGHEFLHVAEVKGAVAVVVENKDAYDKYPNAVLVESTRKALAKAAARWFDEPTKKLKLVGITGTNGKTTTTYLLKSIWDAQNFKAGIIGTVEYQIGDKRYPSSLTTPDPIRLQELFAQMVSENVTHVAMEVSSIALDQYRVGGCHFHTVVFTNLTQDHLDYHKTFEAYAAAKTKLFQSYPTEYVVSNIDDKYGSGIFLLVKTEKKLSVSLQKPSADFFVRDIFSGTEGSHAKVKTPAGEMELRTPLIGKHNIYNCLTAAAVAHCQQIDLNAVMKTLITAAGAPGRLERVVVAEGPFVFVDYAHTDDALENVLNCLKGVSSKAGGNLITVFGCGGDRDKGKRPKMGTVAARYSDITIATSDNPRTENPDAIVDEIEKGIDPAKTNYRREVDRKKAIHLALSLASPNDVVLIAGKGHETYQIIGTETHPFDDREVVREYYR